MLWFAYDGSTNGDWVSHYALRLASRDPERRLRLLHVSGDAVPPETLRPKLRELEERCAASDVTLEIDVLARHPDVAAALLAAVEPGPESLLVCGTRARGQPRGFLSGTVSERLLRAERAPVLALRVVQPGLLGQPRRLLLPVAYYPEQLPARLPFLRLFAPDAEAIHVLLVEEIGRLRFRHLSRSRSEARLARGRAHLADVARVIRDALAEAPVRLETSVVLSDDVPKQIAITANRVQAELVLLGASRRNLTERFVYGNPIEQVLRAARCDVGVYRAPLG